MLLYFAANHLFRTGLWFVLQMHVKRFKGSTSDRGSFQSHLYVTYQLSDRAIQKDTAFDSSEDNLYLLAGTSVRILCVVYLGGGVSCLPFCGQFH